MSKHKYIPPGTRVGVFVLGFLRHEGIVTDGWQGHEQTVISRSRRSGHAKEESMSVFTDRYELRVLPPLSDLHPSLVVVNARRLLGTQWRLADANCEHFVHECFGVEPQSPQLQGWVGIAGATLLLVLLARSG